MLPVKVLPDSYLLSLGTMIVRFNHLEAVIESVLIRCMGLDDLAPRSRIPFVEMKFAQRLECLQTLFGVIAMETLDLRLRDAYEKEIAPKLRGVNTRRNKFIHARMK